MAKARKSLDLVGRRINRLTVVSEGRTAESMSADRMKRRFYWNCLCDCGELTEIREDTLKSGRAYSCGCYRDEIARVNQKISVASGKKRQPENLTGIVFGNLTVISQDEYSTTASGRKLIRWWCTCTCGKGSFSVLGDSLKAGKSTSCGCVTPELLALGFESKISYFISKAKESHGDTYSYDKSTYCNSKENITVTCRVHGDFTINMYNHINGSGCAKCSNEKSYWRVIDRCKRDKEFSDRNCCLYLLRLSQGGEVFLKIGISSNLPNRLRAYAREGFCVDTLMTWESTYLQIALTEFRTLKFIETSHYKYNPIKSFAGHTECSIDGVEEEIITLCSTLINDDNLSDYYTGAYE